MRAFPAGACGGSQQAALRAGVAEPGRSKAQRGADTPALPGPPRLYLTESVYKVVFQKSIPAQIRQLIVYVSNNKG